MLTNDDGIFAPGLIALIRAFRRVADFQLWVVAPDQERSGTGHAITVHHPLMVEEVDLEYGERGWAVSGTPADCVKLAVEAIMAQRPHLVVSGVNLGPNVGADIFYSGTVSAAIEGALMGLPAIAVSLAARGEARYDLAARFAVRLTELVLERGMPPGTLLNVNVPSLDPHQIAGVRVTRMEARQYRNEFDRRVDPRGRVYYWMSGEVVPPEGDGEVDSTALRDNMISVTPLQVDLTARQLLKELCGWRLESCLEQESS